MRGWGQAVLILGGDTVDKTVQTPKLHFSCVTESRAEHLDHFIDFEFKRGKKSTILPPEGEILSQKLLGMDPFLTGSQSLCGSLVTNTVSEIVPLHTDR